MNKSELSKRKYIYKVYQSCGDNSFHIERYPIIYTNSAYVYFKVANKQELGRVDFRRIKDRISDLKLTVDSTLYSGEYIWYDPNITDSEFNRITKEFRRKQYEGLIEDKKNEIKRLEFRLGYAVGELHKLESEKDNV